jgi:hypothetical protein
MAEMEKVRRYVSGAATTASTDAEIHGFAGFVPLVAATSANLLHICHAGRKKQGC